MKLTAERLRELLHYDEETGIFSWRASCGNQVKANRAAGHVDKRNGYRTIRVDGTLYFAHRLAWLYVHGRWPEADIDHINGARDENRIGNLRQATRAENLQNRRLDSGKGAAKLLGVVRHKQSGKWQAKIKKRGVDKHLGFFDSAEEAHSAYLAAKSKIHPFSTIGGMPA